MGFFWICFCLTSIVVQNSGELIVLRHPLTENGSKRKLTCISENDDAALIWNYNPTYRDEARKLRNELTNFQPKKSFSTECAIRNSTVCLAEWESRSEWEVVNSTIIPMGPVVDYRWEEFEEFVADQTKGLSKYRYVGKIKSSGSAVFSVRGLREVHVLLCENESLTKGRCIQILIGGWWHRMSEIWTCVKGAPMINQFKTEKNCENIARFRHGEDIFKAYEWRTFTLKWDSDKKSVQLFKDSDRNNEPFLQGLVKQWHPVSHISMRSETLMRVRFHFYEYYTTDKKDSVLYTKKFHHIDEHFCVELLFGICPKCKLNLSLVDSNNNSLNIGSFSGDENSVYNGLVTWRSVKLNTTIENFRLRPVRLEIRTILTDGESKGQWAIGNLKMCQSAGELRQSTLTISKSMTKSHDEIWPEVWCQKLSYNKSALVDIQSTSLANNDMSQSQRLISRWLASCLTLCKNFGKKWSICNTAGCTCDRGFTGSDCNEGCTNGRYGYNCNDECGSCDNGYCNTTTGYCSAGCTSNEVLPPFCKTEKSETEKILDIEELRTNFISDTEVTIKWKPSSSKNEIFNHYNVSIKIDTLLGCDNLKRPTPVDEEISETVTNPEVSFNGLRPYAKYIVTVVAYTTIYGEPKSISFRTSEKDIPTSKFANLRLSSDEHSLEWDEPVDCTTITGTMRATKLYFAGVSESVRSWTYMYKTAYTSLKLNILGLTPYTNYRARVYVLRGYHLPENSTNYEELTWRTRPTAPPAVTELEIYETDPDSNTISLRWIPPNPANGEIESYHVSINEAGLFKNWDIKVSEEIMTCKLSSNYICLENLTLPSSVATRTQVQVYAKNKDVEQPGDQSSVLFLRDSYHNMEPSSPVNFDAIPQGYGSVMLTWGHPIFVYSKITRFEIVVRIVGSVILHKSGSQYPMMVNYSVVQTQKEYSMMLHLLPSTVYNFSIVAVNRHNIKSRQAEVTRLVTGSVGFKDKMKPRMQFSGSSIEIEIPKIVNATLYTRVKVIVKGLSTCAPNRLQTSFPLVNQTRFVTEWDAAMYQVADHVPESLEISAKQNHGVTLDCSLHLDTSYTILFVLTDWYSSTMDTLATSPITLTQSWSKLVSHT